MDQPPEIFKPFADGVRVSLASLKKRKEVVEANTGAIFMIDADEKLVKQIKESRKQNAGASPAVKKSS